MTTAPAFEELLAGLRDQLATLPDKPEETAAATLRALWHAAAGAPKSTELASEAPLPVLGTGQHEMLRRLIERRLAGAPLAHLTGKQRFLGLEMLVGPEALIPRKETELLAQTALDLLAAAEPGGRRVVDVCTGCGNVAVAIARRAPGARVFASDLSAEAVALAQRNAEQLGVADLMHFRAGDLLAPFDLPDFRGNVDMITCNPPYIATTNVERMPDEIARHEPRLAFDGGPFGVSILRRLMHDAPRLLRPSGWLVFEVGLGQGPSMVRMLEKHAEFSRVTGVSDAHGAVRVVTAQRR
jgi:release factor glutamine methyltransferase